MPDASEPPYRIGAARTEITPALSVPYLGFQPRHSPFSGVHDSLFVRVVYLAAGARAVVLVNTDLIGLADTLLGPGRSFIGEVKQAIAAGTGVPADAILLAASHAHSTPDTLDFRPLRIAPGARAWLESLVAIIGKTAVAAQRNAFPACLRTGFSAFPSWAKNRRHNPDCDDRVSFLLFTSLDTQRRILLVHYACHPVIVQAQPLVSADYPGAMQKAVESQLAGTDCLFFQGACADINPVMDDSRDFADVERMGSALACLCLEFLRPPSPPLAASAEASSLNYAVESVRLIARPMPGSDEVVALRTEYDTLKNRRTADGTADARLLQLEEMFARLKDTEPNYLAVIQGIRIGSTILLAVPGEPTGCLGRKLAARGALTLGFANGYLGYFMPPDDWERGGYEVSLGPWSKVDANSHAAILAAADRVLHALVEVRDQPR
jgi:neutral ceramidase